MRGTPGVEGGGKGEGYSRDGGRVWGTPGMGWREGVKMRGTSRMEGGGKDEGYFKDGARG